MVFRFADTLSGVGSAAVSSGTGHVVSGAMGSDTHEYIVELTGVTNAQHLFVALRGVSDSAGHRSDAIAAPMSVLLGDTSADKSVNSADISQTKSQSGQTVSSTNFRSDVTADGNLNSADISLVKSKSGTALPSAP
jgi:hypothetical protein